MVIHVVQPGETLYGLSLAYGVPLSLLALDNGLTAGGSLVVGQALVVRFPSAVHTVQPGETLSDISRRYGIDLRTLYRNNPVLGGTPKIWPGETIVLAYRESPGKTVSVNAYAYPFIGASLLRSTLPFLTYLTPFTYGFTPEGELVAPQDDQLLRAARTVGTLSLLHLSTLTQEGEFSNELAHLLLNNPSLQDKVIAALLETITEKGYAGLDVDFEYVFPEDSGAYAAFLGRVQQALHARGYPLIVALAPKTSTNQRGALYEGHDYAAIGAVADRVFLMTYEWGYTYGPPMAVSPLPNVRQVVEYALTEIPAWKIWLGIPNYGYDWPLPFVQGESRATSISSQQAVAIARRHGASISYDEQAQSPWFRYTDSTGVVHEVWFEDARSIRAKLLLLDEYGLSGAGYWNLMREFPQNWVVLSSLYNIRQGLL